MAWDSSETGTGWITTSVTESKSILFKVNAIAGVIRQKEVVSTFVKRGLTAGSTTGDRYKTIDNTTQTTYYRHTTGTTYSFTATTGSKTVLAGARVDESGQWHDTKTVTEYSIEWPSANEASNWDTTELDADGNATTLTANGIESVLSYDKVMNLVKSASDKTLISTVTTTVKVRKYVNTLAQAQSIANDNTSSNVTTVTACFSTYIALVQNPRASDYSWVTSLWIQIPSGTEKHASVSYVSAKAGYSVTITEKTYGNICPADAPNPGAHKWSIA